MADKMEPVAWRVRDFAGEWILCPSEKATHTYTTSGKKGEPLYTANQVKELTDRLEKAEAALADARKVIEPFAKAADATIESDERGDAVAWEHSCAAAVDLDDFRAARTWYETHKGER